MNSVEALIIQTINGNEKIVYSVEELMNFEKEKLGILQVVSFFHLINN